MPISWMRSNRAAIKRTSWKRISPPWRRRCALLSRIRDLEEERKRLEDGQPCPLCGATEHPYAKGNLPVLNEAEADLKKRKDEFKKVSHRLGELEAGRVKTAAEIEHTEKEMAEKKTALDADQKQCADALSRLKMKAFPGGALRKDSRRDCRYPGKDC